MLTPPPGLLQGLFRRGKLIPGSIEGGLTRMREDRPQRLLRS
ncbi:hypothetical protein M2120_001502 [Aurantimicrobium minutum]|nr:hypothetical protein [Aurantimicrobium minutum]